MPAFPPVPPESAASPEPPALSDLPGPPEDLHSVATPDPVVTELLHRLPEFGPTYQALVEEFDDDPGGPVVFTELADFVADHLVAAASDQRLLGRSLAAVEAIADQGDELSELIAYAFLDSLSPEDRHLVGPWLGPSTRSLLDGLEVGDDWPPEASPVGP
jgi:hypothetical protein